MHRSSNQSRKRSINLFLVLFTTLGLTLGNFTVFDFDPPAEAAHLRGSLVTAEYHAHGGDREVHIQSTELVAKPSSGSSSNPTVYKAADASATRTAISCTFTNKVVTQDTTNPLFNITTTSWTVTNCFTEAAEYTFESAVCCKIGGIKNITNSASARNQFEIKLVISDLAQDTAAPTYSSGYMNNILYDSGSVGAEVDYTTNLNALAEGNQPVASYELVTSQSAALGGYGASRIPCSNLDTTTGQFSINAASCQGSEALTAFSTSETAILYALKVRAIDAKGQYATRDVLLAFNTSSNKRPVFTSTAPSPGPLQAIPGGSPVTISLTASDDDSGNTLAFNLNTSRSWITASTVSQSIVDGKKVATIEYTLAPPSGTEEILQLQISVFDNDTFSLSSTIQYDIEAGGVLPPGAPAKPTVLFVDGTSARVSFAAPVSGGTVSSYFVVRTPIAGGTSVETYCEDGPSQPCVITGLDSSTPYNFQIRAANSSASATSVAASMNSFIPMSTGLGSSFSTDDFSLGGDASFVGNVATLTPNLGSKKGAIWSKSRTNMNSDFMVEARLFLGDGSGLGSGADGIAFVMQPNSSTALTSGGGLGYAGMTPPVFAVEFDTFNNGGEEGASNHMALMKDGSSTAHSSWGVGLVDVVNLEDNNWRDFRFIWKAPTTSPAADGKIRVEFDLNHDGDFTDAGEIVFELDVPLDTYFAGSNGNVYWGFTAATGGSANLQRVEITRYSGVSRSNAAPTLALSSSDPVGLAAGTTKAVQLTLSDDSTTQAQWTLSGVSSNSGNVAVSSVIANSSTTATLNLSSPALATSGTETVTVTARDADGATVTLTLEVGIGTAPGAPTLLTGIAGNALVNLSWQAPADTGGFDLINYVVEFSVGTSGTWSTVSRSNSVATSASITQLVNGTAYKFRVSAVTAAGKGEPSSETALITPAAPAAGSAPIPTPSPSASPSTRRPTPAPPRPQGGITPPPLFGQNPQQGQTEGTDNASGSNQESGSTAQRPNLIPTLIPERISNPGVVYSPSNPIPQDLVELLFSPLAYPNSGSLASPVLPTLSPQESMAYENGSPVVIELVTTDNQNGYVLRGTNWEVALEATDPSGAPLRLDETGNIILNTDRIVRFQGTGFAPGSIIKLWLFSDPTSLTDVRADSSGSFAGSSELPFGISNGEHTVQLNGITEDGQVRSVSLGVLVQPNVITAPTITPIDFAPLWNLALITAGVAMMFLLALIGRRRWTLALASRKIRRGKKTERDMEHLLIAQLAGATPLQQFPVDSRRKLGKAAPPKKSKGTPLRKNRPE